MTTTNGTKTITINPPASNSGATVTLPLAEYLALTNVPRLSQLPPTAEERATEMRRPQAERDSNRAAILAALKASERPISRRDVLKATGLADNVVKIDLYNLVRERKVKRIGGKKNSTYRLAR